MMTDLEANRDRDEKLPKEEENHRPERSKFLVLAGICVCICVSILAFLLFYPMILHRDATPAVRLHSFSQSPLSVDVGLRPYNISWDVTFRFSNPSSGTPISYTHLLASIDWIRIPCTDPIRLAEAALPDFHQGMRAISLINSTLDPVELAQENACDNDALLDARIWHMRLQLQDDVEKKASNDATKAPLISCTEITLDAATSRIIGHPTKCTV